MIKMPSAQKNDLQSIPGVGVSMAKDISDLGINSVAELRNKDAQKMYDDLIALRGVHQDRCVLYVFRCAVYYAENSNPDAELLKWWNWKDA